MILYNVRQRGTYEYDKFVLNALQLHNEIQRLIREVKKSSETSIYTTVVKFDELIDELSNPYSVGQELLCLRKGID